MLALRVDKSKPGCFASTRLRPSLPGRLEGFYAASVTKQPRVGLASVPPDVDKVKACVSAVDVVEASVGSEMCMAGGMEGPPKWNEMGAGDTEIPNQEWDI
jgi:hypothetical protein